MKTEMERLMDTNNKRRQSNTPEDQAYMAHWYACRGSHQCTVFGLCPKGLRLDQICRGAVQTTDLEDPEKQATMLALNEKCAREDQGAGEFYNLMAEAQ